jgi:hypothetical protein
MTLDQLIQATLPELTNELRSPKYRSNDNPLAGHCYVASESLYWLYRMYGDGLYILDTRYMKWEGEPHWFLLSYDKASWDRKVIDLTASQFKEQPDYQRGQVNFFMTTFPSERSQIVISRVREKLGLK